jgi:hypothetical protein
MHPASFFARAPLRGLLIRALAGIALMGAATSYAATSDGLAISGTPPASATVGQYWTFQSSVYNPSGRALNYAIANAPSWIGFNNNTGGFAGIPPASAAGTTLNNLLISVSDGVTKASLPAFSIQVSGTASTVDQPVISGTPASSVTAGSSYAFQPSAKDPAGKPLSFSVQNKPAWASFSIASGLLNGTPSSTQTGTYSNIIISASNGTYSSALPAFNVTVGAAAATTGSAKLSWTLPTVNTNGTAVTGLAGTRLYYGTSASALTHSIQVAGTSTTTYTVTGLTSGTWYFGAEAYTTTGTASGMSGVVSKTIP